MRLSFVALPLLFVLPIAAQTPTPKLPAPTTTALPVTRISLYKNGVGYFEHTGSVSGNASVTIDFTSGQLNDVLQSLTAIDLGGGRISGAGYNSTTPLDQQLKNLPINLEANPTSADFYAAIRGARVEVRSGAISIAGRLLSVEDRTATAPEGNDSHTPITRQFLTVIAEDGTVRTLELTPATSVRLLNTPLHTDVTRYLQLIDANRNQGLRHLTLLDLAPAHPTTPQRTLQLSYISEVPVWKSTYRILFTEKGAPGPDSGARDATATLQGWSVVDNTTGIDWVNVHLSLIAGAPQSFIQPLSQPIYSRRPEIPIAQEAQLTPQTFESGIDEDKVSNLPAVGRDVQSYLTMQPGVAAASASPRKMQIGTATGNGNAIGGGMTGNAGGGVMHLNSSTTYEDAITASTSIAAATAAFDDFFAYNITEPVTIRKNESALVPILQAKITADRVTLVSSNGNALRQPLRALWITNTSGLTLDRGSFTLIEDGSFGGEGLLDPIHAGEKRLLSYAADQAIHVSTEGNKSNQHATFLRGSKGVLNIHHAEFHEITYVIRNAAAEPRTVVLEEPVVSGFKLDSETPGSTDPKPVETTPTVYRFRVVVPAGQTIRLHSGATRSGYTTYYLTRSDENQFNLILNQSGKNPELIAALQPILDARRKVADAQTAVDQTNKRLTDLRSDEDRQRSNITALATADKASRDRFVHDLNTTEDTIAAAQKELTTRTATLDAAKADLANRIQDFHINTSKNPAEPDTEP